MFDLFWIGTCHSEVKPVDKTVMQLPLLTTFIDLEGVLIIGPFPQKNGNAEIA